MCDQAAIVPRFTLSLPVDAYTQWKKVGSLLSSCWHLRKTMPIHSLGIEALSGLDQSLFVSFGRGIPSLCIPLQWKKGVLLQGCRPHCEFRRLAANKKQTCILNDRSSFTETHIRNTKKERESIKTCQFYCYSCFLILHLWTWTKHRFTMCQPVLAGCMWASRKQKPQKLNKSTQNKKKKLFAALPAGLRWWKLQQQQQQIAKT